MLRSVMEIATFSHLGKINANHRFGFRDFSGYHRKMLSGLKQGWLVYSKDEKKWSLHPTMKQGKPTYLFHSNDILKLIFDNSDREKRLRAKLKEDLKDDTLKNRFTKHQIEGRAKYCWDLLNIDDQMSLLKANKIYYRKYLDNAYRKCSDRASNILIENYNKLPETCKREYRANGERKKWRSRGGC